MSLDYDKLKKKEGESASEKMASYSDLYTVIAFVFLAMYIVANVRSTVYSLVKNSEKKVMQAEIADYKQQLKVYEALKQDQLQKVTQDEQAVYEELMGKLTLLQDEAKQEKEDLIKQAAENEKKEVALNQYQQIIRNIINANILAKERIQRRDDNIVRKRETIIVQKEDIEEKAQVIVEKQQDIEQKSQLIVEKETIIAENENIIEQKSAQVNELSKDVEEKKQAIAINNENIAKLNNSLERKIADLNAAYKLHKTTKAEMQAAIEKIQQSTANQISQIKGESTQYQKQLEDTNDKLHQTTTQLTEASAKISAQNAEKARLAMELEEASKSYEQLKAENEQAFADLQRANQESMDKLKSDYAEQMAKDKADFDAAMNAVKMSASERAKKEQEFRAKMLAEKAALDGKLAGLASEINDANQALLAANAEKEKLSRDVAMTQSQLDAAKAKAVADMNRQKEDFEKKIALERETFLRNLEKQKLSANAKAKALKEFQEKTKKEKAELNDKIAVISDDLKKAQELLAAKKKLANEIMMNFKKAGIEGDVDPETGDVTISFGQDYFETGRADLKPSMKDTLRKFMPTYSMSLFKDEKIAQKISSVEIIGFSSPTYQGKYIDPSSLDPQYRSAVDFNLDLSFKRAKAVFTYIFDTTSMTYKYQDRLSPLVKVTGRSFLATEIKGRNIASGMTQREYCEKHNCKKSQKVIIKFNLEDK
ncbi:MAG: hypothetical protein A2504_14165 [Bdellovibrionales bacterium RIFOXYD12_FULL_39_22]|nr:MAG: hypothetical protein A2385_04600 [Bdellovibrionales bacterium RIFOXYB1_FULL_39_21]OFZ43428.1 MAG: hypothetical protein A2485_13115 [Bdellovibrionales bacterium RIFOXYC12_FULL_39_17]OFZ46971.1 MAG: hypothetical protein A2404_00175 [Bdellovibrionales bacterium RIFOXYC1_FULL_39_130]OFZ76168.1 MAG: hypothetical protein A2560_07425 [Bdellovibrionales bacterium RIFOXYD1_FULL_39_84]OFZ94403.1 MAG: hypothetical protein A2504_14165 [Bdellovibrionales bacterium RIFOXYD12_FULL_39_22]HLE10557.1 hy